MLLFDHPRHLKYGVPLWDLSALGGVAAVYGSPGNRLNANIFFLVINDRPREDRVDSQTIGTNACLTYFKISRVDTFQYFYSRSF